MMAHDPGGRVRYPLDLFVSGGAVFADDDRYRISLWRCWGDPKAPFALWIGMNPSTATADADDPTVRRETEFTRRLGFPRFVKMNVSAYRATDPARLSDAPIACAENLPAILEAAREAAVIVLAFGVLRGRMRELARTMVAALRAEQRPLMCLGRTADGSPRHPLYVKSDTLLVAWEGWIERKRKSGHRARARAPAPQRPVPTKRHLRVLPGGLSDVA